MGGNLTGTIGGKSIIGTLGSGQIVMGQNVIPDWNQNDPQAEDYIKNRPGGYDTPPTVDISWDGDLTGKEKVHIEGDVAYLVKIANEAPPFESFNTDKVFVELETIYSDGTTSSESGETTVSLYESGDAYAIGDTALGVSSDYFENNGMTLSKGLWFVRIELAKGTVFVKHIASDGAVKFPVKYMPNDIMADIREAQTTANEAQTTANEAQTTANEAQTTADAAKTASDALGSAFFNDTVTFTYDGSTTGKTKFVYNAFTYYKISDYVPNVDFVERSSVIAQSGRVITGIVKGTNCAEYGGLCVAVENAGSCILENISFTAPERGLYACTGNASVTLKSITFNMFCDEHYMFLASSTANSTKKFKMTVDDTGTPSFTDTGDAANKFTPVTPSELAEKQDVLTDADKQSITKTGMTSGAAWTAVEQKAARERMGVDKPYELIEEIVLSESITQVVRTSMSLAEMRIVVEVPVSDSAGAVAIEVYSESTLIGYGYIGNLINKENIKMAKFAVKRDHGNYVFSVVSVNGNSASQKAGVSALNETASLFPVENAITKISLHSTSNSISLPIGTKITIEGETI